jgi:Protein of unknown function (DUF1592)/Protein of unknown function (DUF1588)/Protein of unknown function (DUF1585)
MFLLVLVALAWPALPNSPTIGSRVAGVSAQTSSGLSQVIDTYCAGCHNGRIKSASGVVLEQLDATQIAASPDLWSRAYRQLQAGAMPPFGSPRPDRTASDAALLSIEQALAAHAASPAAPNSRQIATRLAALLWNTAPDAALLQEAQHDGLSDPAVLERHIHRMLADDRAQAFVARFFFPWLQLDTLGKADPDRQYFPDYDVSLRDAFAKETELFLLSQLRADRDPVDLWAANYTFVNERLATHYGVANVTGAEFRRIVWSTPERAGLLGHGSILMATSRHEHGVDAGYTTPATRAKWVRLHFLGASLPNGFPGAQPVKPELPITPQTRALPAAPCTNCHQNFFPLGYALENFDPIGRWRTHDQAGRVDASGAFVDGTPINGVVELRQVLLQRPEAFRTTITEKLLVYASTGFVVGSGTPDTLVRARQILRGTPAPPWSALIAAVVRRAGL